MMLERLKLEAMTALTFWAVFVFGGALVSVWVALWFMDFAGIWNAWLQVFSTSTLAWTGAAAIALTAAITLLDKPTQNQ